MKKFITTLLSMLLVFIATAQDTANDTATAQSTGLRADGKIYVVVAVIVTILLGLYVYIIRLDRKISKLEKHS
ncbi:CcmD family protein [Pseudoflavitalea sp. G-6-1-2]|uniref:CcmD family protein n=1 Tax=Pseudoflavitalea sp. G-6-1-2 TaxID=2728841 RepID=UPI00146AB61A|nr:CcmD family protein [Pseudoflavitalea sp. G-6-1-2]NML22832.1 CcmD family protein [Pseudoflavitalea sp. G-6-1-2]